MNALWMHRYRKYSHLAKVYWYFWIVYFRLKGLKISTLRKKKIVVIILTQQFGDIVVAEPISRQVREKYVDDYIIWLVKPAFAELLESNPNINETLLEFCAHQRQLLLHSNIFDEVFNLQLRNNSHCPICGTYIINSAADTAEITIHNYYFHGNLLTIQQKIARLPELDLPPKLYISEANRQKVDQLQLPNKFFVIHCQSNQASRDWTADKWEQLVQWLLDKYPEYSLVEIGLVSNLAIKNARYLNCCGALSLLETAEVIRRAKVYIGVDSGPAHLANAVGTFGVIMLGKLANFTEHIPYSGDYKNGKNAVLIRNIERASAEISVQEVKGVLEKVIYE